MSPKSISFLERVTRNLGSLFVALFVLSAAALAITTWAPGSAPAAGPGSGNVVLPAGVWTNYGSNIAYTTGNVGIGVTAPAAGLDVLGNIVIRHPTVSGIVMYGGAANDQLFGAVGASSSGIYIGLADADKRIMILNTGNVGIGTNTPSTKLEVAGGAIKATGGLIIETRTSDPATPVVGQIWLRTDI
jgi:hypothetical protein